MFPGRTFKYPEQGSVGLAGDKKVYIASSGLWRCDGDNSPVDYQEGFIKSRV